MASRAALILVRSPKKGKLFFGLFIPFKAGSFSRFDGLPVILFDSLIDSKKPARIAVAVDGNRAIGSRRFGGGKERGSLRANHLADGPVGAVRVYDSKIAPFVIAISARVSPKKDAVTARFRHQAVKIAAKLRSKSSFSCGAPARSSSHAL